MRAMAMYEAQTPEDNWTPADEVRGLVAEMRRKMGGWGDSWRDEAALWVKQAEEELGQDIDTLDCESPEEVAQVLQNAADTWEPEGPPDMEDPELGWWDDR